MMNLPREYLFKHIIFALFIVLTACGSNKQEQTTIESSPVNQPGSIENFYISDADQLQIAAITIGEINEIHIGNEYLFRDCKDGSKCKYRNEDGKTVYDVKYKDEGFKIRDPEGNLLLKVKTSNGKIKIGLDEEMEDPYQIKLPSPDKASLVNSDKEVGQARMGQDALPVKVTDGKNTCYIAGPRKSQVKVVIALPDADLKLRIVLLTELLIKE
ncbi:hypothetical protein ACFLU5_16030 [Bacteroidota bacterium]